MKWRTELALFILAWLLMAGLAMAQPTEAQWLKLLGYMPDIPIEECDQAAPRPALARQAGIGERMCMFPDHADLSIASADPSTLSDTTSLPLPDCEGLIRAHKSILAAVGQGSYPHSCDPQWPNVHAITMFRDVGSYGDHMKRPLTDSEFQSIINAKVWGPSGDPTGRPFTMDELKQVWGDAPLWQVVDDFTAETYRRLGVLITTIPTHDEHDNIHVLSRRIPGSTIGIGWFPSAAPCPGDQVEFHIDSSYTAGFQGQFGLDIHECGHTLQLPHQFPGQKSHQEPMSYFYGNHLVVGYVTKEMESIVGLPESPSVSLLTKLYGGEPVGIPWRGKFQDNPDDPTPPQPPGDFPFVVGDQFDWLLRGKRMTLEVMKIDTDEGESLADRIREAYESVEDYARKDRHRSSIATLYDTMATVVDRGADPEAAHQSLQLVRSFLLGSHLDKWQQVFAIADTVKTADGFRSVAEGLSVSEVVQLNSDDLVALTSRANELEFEISPIIVLILKQLIENLPDDRPFLKVILQVVLSILEDFDTAESAESKPQTGDGASQDYYRQPFPAEVPVVSLAV